MTASPSSSSVTRPGVSDADLKDPLKATYAIVWQNDGQDHVAIGWANPKRSEPFQPSHDQLIAFANDLKAIGETLSEPAPVTSSPGEGILKPQAGLISKTTQVLGPCGTARRCAWGKDRRRIERRDRHCLHAGPAAQGLRALECPAGRLHCAP